MRLIDFILPVENPETYTFAAFLGVSLGINLVRILVLQWTAFFISATHFGLKRRIYRLTNPLSQLKQEFASTITGGSIDALVFAAFWKFKPLVMAGDNVWQTFFLSFVLMEITFYTIHRALHTRKLYFIHRHHHVARVVSPMSAFSFSVSERLVINAGFMIPILLLSNYMPISYLGLGLHVAVNYALGIFIHMNVEVTPSWWLKFPVLNFLNPPTHHSMHHARYTGHFGLFTPFLDRILGTEFHDYAKVHGLAASGQGLESLGSRPERQERREDFEPVPKVQPMETIYVRAS